MKILFIAPLPPPITGQSLAVEVAKKHLEQKNNITVINLVKDTFENGADSFGRVIEIFSILKNVARNKKGKDVIYFTIAESIAGNLKDLFIYLICYRQLSKIIIHLHGGAGMRVILGKKNILCFVNIFFLKRLKNIIVLGESQRNIFPFVNQAKVHVVPNFAQNELYISNADFEQKYRDLDTLQISYISNLIPGKGYKELFQALENLPLYAKKKINVTFAGGFETEKDKLRFLEDIKHVDNIDYVGIVHGEMKKQLFHRTHIFCLPTYYAYEGQPISIIEAYASGCAVLTTNHSGIIDIFKNKVNGFLVDKMSVTSIQNALMQIIECPEVLKSIALTNYKEAEAKYRIDIYNKRLHDILTN